jgi:N-acetylglucosaminyl-diphospho-decaprenol L-rhamnosyltransferase
MTVSVLVVNYRAYDELARCLESLVPWLADDVEGIVVDHGSAPERAAAISRSFPSVRLLPTSANPGFAAGVNRAATYATGRYLLLLNPDAVMTENVCRSLASWLDARAAIGVAGPLIRDQDGSIQASARRFPGISTVLGGRSTALTRFWPGNPLSRHNLLTGPGVRTPRQVDWVSGACLMTRREAYDKVGGLDEGFFLYWEDADYCRRVGQAGWQTWYHPGMTVTHLAGRSSAHVPGPSRTAFYDSVYRYFRKHSGPVGAVLSPLAWLGLRARLGLERLGRSG